MKIVPPNFGYVEETFFRCGVPSPVHFPFLEQLRLRHCVVLSDTVDATFLQWLQDRGIRASFPMAGITTTTTMTTTTTTQQQQRNGQANNHSHHTNVGSSGGYVLQPYGTSSTTSGGSGGVQQQLASPVEPTAPSPLPLQADGSMDAAGRGAGVLSSSTSSAAPQQTTTTTNTTTAYVVTALHGGGGGHHRGSMALPEPTVTALLQLCLDPINRPLLVCCAQGRYRTGVLVGCFRKLQHWNLMSILEEYRRFTGTGRSRLDNEEFIELFDKDLVVVVAASQTASSTGQQQNGGAPPPTAAATTSGNQRLSTPTLVGTFRCSTAMRRGVGPDDGGRRATIVPIRETAET